MTTDKASERTKSSEEQFPVKLHRILDDAETEGFSDIITWMPGGTSFKILDKNKLETVVMPRYFSSCRFKSFQRSLNLWGFVADNKRSDSISGGGRRHHPMFVKGKPELCAKMSRIRVKEPGSRATGKTIESPSSPEHQIHQVPEKTENPIPKSCCASVPGMQPPLQHQGLESFFIPPISQNHRTDFMGNPNMFQLSQHLQSDGFLNILLTQSLSNPWALISPAMLDAAVRQQQKQKQQQHAAEAMLLENAIAKYFFLSKPTAVTPQSILSKDTSCNHISTPQQWDLASAILLLQQQQNQK